MLLRIEQNVGQQPHALVSRSARASERECDYPILSAGSQARSHTMRRSQTYISLKKGFVQIVFIQPEIDLECDFMSFIFLNAAIFNIYTIRSTFWS